MPNVIRPSQGQMAKSGGTPQSILSRASYASPYNNQQIIGKNTKFAPVGGINSGRIFHGKAQQQNHTIQPQGGLFATPNKVAGQGQSVSKDVHDSFLKLF